jgi:radical SAM protein with 4Fe4S-binding SPASM domain
VSSSVTKSDALRPRNAKYHGAASTPAWSCPSGLDKLYVDPNGDCYPCCYGEGHDAMRLGNAFTDRLSDLFAGPRARQIRRSFATREGFVPFCEDRCSTRPTRVKLRLWQAGSRGP